MHFYFHPLLEKNLLLPNRPSYCQFPIVLMNSSRKRFSKYASTKSPVKYAIEKQEKKFPLFLFLPRFFLTEGLVRNTISVSRSASPCTSFPYSFRSQQDYAWDLLYQQRCKTPAQAYSCKCVHILKINREKIYRPKFLKHKHYIKFTL